MKQNTNTNVKKPFFNEQIFSNNNNNKFILLLQKGVYLYEYIDDWQKFSKRSLPEKEDFYRKIFMHYCQLMYLKTL